MLEWLERLWKRSSTDDPGFILRYELSFKNETLGLRSQGFPFEVVAEMREDGQDPSPLANHIYTEIKVAEVFQDAPVLEFHGGSHAEGVMELLDSLVAGDLTTARSLLEGDPAILTGAHDGAPIPLLAEVFAGRVATVRFLVENGARVDEAGHLEMSPLHRAAACGHSEIAKELLGTGANGEVLSSLYVTPLDVARLKLVDELAATYEAGNPDSECIEAVLNSMGCRIED